MTIDIRWQGAAVFLMLTSFLLGWHMRGDKIYGGMYEQQTNNPMMKTLAENLNGKTSSK